MFVKNPNAEHEGCRIYYKDIGDYLTREQKLWIVDNAGRVDGVDDWESINPDENYDWVNLGDPTYSTHLPIGSPDVRNEQARDALMYLYSRGIESGKDVWVFDMSSTELLSRAQRMSNVFNGKLDALKNGVPIDELTRPQPSLIKLDSPLIQRLRRQYESKYDVTHLRKSMYRPFVPMYVYFDRFFMNTLNRLPMFFPIDGADNKVINTPTIGITKEFSALVTDTQPDLNLMQGGQAFPRFYYEEVDDSG